MKREVRTTLRRARGVVMALLMLVLAGCASTHYPINDPLTAPDANGGYRNHALRPAERNSDSIFLSVAFSGGGMRAAALGYGVLQAMAETTFAWEGKERSLLDEIDLVAGVSGGSMVAAYFAAKGTSGWAAFKQDFLEQDVQGALLSKTLSPRNLFRLTSSRFGRTDLLAELLDERLFGGMTFGELAKRGTRPLLLIGASNMTSGERFEFTQDHFDLICSDISNYPIARAVAASSAAPLVLSPITLWSFGSGCYAQLDATSSEAARAFRHAHLAKHARQPNRFIHLLDGGLSDNVGGRGPLDFIGQFGSVIAGARASGYKGVRHAVFVLVNAESSVNDPQDRSANVPGIVRSIFALADIPINRYSGESLSRMRHELMRWQDEVRRDAGKDPYGTFAPDAKFHLIEVALRLVPDAAQRELLLAIPTRLYLDAQEREALIDYGKRALKESPEFGAFMRAVQGAAPAK